MPRTANELTEDQIAIYLEVSSERFKELMLTTENVIRDSHKEIIEYLEKNCNDKKVINELRKELKL